MTSQKPRKKAHELTTKEAMARLFPPEVIEYADRHVAEADAKSAKRPAGPKKSMSEE